MASGIYGIFTAGDAEFPSGSDVVLATVAVSPSSNPYGKTGSFSAEYSRAYKNILLSLDQEEFATIVLPQPERSPKSARLCTQTCLSARAPANWARVTRFAQWALATLFGVGLRVYVDDCLNVKPDARCNSALYSTKSFNALTVLKRAMNKARPTRTQSICWGRK